MRASIALAAATIVAGLSAAPTVGAAELVMVEEAGCIWCARWNAEIAPIYPKTPEAGMAPLRRIDKSVRDPEDFSYASRVVYTPTFVLVEDGRELGRIEGYPGESFFWDLLGRLLRNLEENAGGS